MVPSAGISELVLWELDGRTPSQLPFMWVQVYNLWRV